MERREGECILGEMGEVGKTRVKNWAASTVLRRTHELELPRYGL